MWNWASSTIGRQSSSGLDKYLPRSTISMRNEKLGFGKEDS
jgi:hypothetical protein